MKNNYYSVSKELGCCYNCEYAKTGYQICLTCNNKKAWEKTTSVEPTGGCRYFERKKNDKTKAR